MAITPEVKALEAAHKLTLDSRSRLQVSGVSDIESFDENTIVLHTTRGTLVVKGRSLHLQMLSLDGGQVCVDGTVDALSYEEETPSGGFFARLFG